MEVNGGMPVLLVKPFQQCPRFSLNQSECSYRHSDFLFDKVLLYTSIPVGVNSMESQHDPDHLNAGEVMKKCGLIDEGALREKPIGTIQAL